MRLLLVEDSPDDRLWLSRLIEQGFPGVDLISAQTAEAALERLTTESFDLVFSDNILPGMSGIELVQAMRGLHMFVPVVLLTGYEGTSAVEASISAGAVSLLSKDGLTEAKLQDVYRQLNNLTLRPLDLGLEPIKANTAELVGKVMSAPLRRLYGDINAVRNRMGDVDPRLEAEQIDAFERTVMECEGALDQALSEFMVRLEAAR